MHNLLSKFWKYLGKHVQWYLMWLVHSKLNVGLSIIIPHVDGRVLVAKHVFSGPKPWRLIGGYINKNENIYDAARREAKEELGIDIDPERVIRIRSGFAYRLEITIVAKPLSVTEFLINKKEIKEVGWFALENLPEDILESHKYLLKLYRDSPENHIEINNL